MIDNQILSIINVSVFGAVLGSFYNVLIYRIPLGKSIVYPASACPECGEKIKYYDNIPILSYLFLKGKCRRCGTSISIQYLLIEIITALIAGFIFAKNGFHLNFISDFTLASILLISSAIDLKYMIIPNKITYTGAIIGIALSLFRGKEWILRSALGAGVGFLFIMSMLLLGRILYRRDGVGYGDVKLAMVTGIFIGPLWCFISLVAAVVTGGLWGIFQIISGRPVKGIEMPFGPFIAAGGIFVLFYNEKILYLLSKYLN